jgi:hypothetical protein
MHSMFVGTLLLKQMCMILGCREHRDGSPRRAAPIRVAVAHVGGCNTWHVHACPTSVANWRLLLPPATTRGGLVMLGAENRGRRSVRSPTTACGRSVNVAAQRQSAGAACYEAWTWAGEEVSRYLVKEYRFRSALHCLCTQHKMQSGHKAFACICWHCGTEEPCLTRQPLPCLTVAVSH